MNNLNDLHAEQQDQMLNVINDVNNGDLPVLDALIYLEQQRKKLELSLEIAKAFKDDFFERIAEQAEEYKDGYNGYKIEVRNGGKIYSYKNIPEWVKAEQKKKDIEAKYKSALEAKLKGNAYAGVSEDGEELPMPEISYRKSSIVLKEQFK